MPLFGIEDAPHTQVLHQICKPQKPQHHQQTQQQQQTTSASAIQQQQSTAIGGNPLSIGINIPHTVVYEHDFPKGLFHTDSEGVLHRQAGKDLDSKAVVEMICPKRIHLPSHCGLSSKRAIHPEALPRATRQGGGGAESMAHSVLGVRKPRTSLDESLMDDDVAIVATFITLSAPADDDAATASKSSAMLSSPHITKPRHNASTSQDAVVSRQYTVQYFTRRTLRRFLQGREGVKGTDTTTEGSPQDVGAAGSVSQPSSSSLGKGHKNGVLQRFLYPSTINNEVIQVTWTPHVIMCDRLKNENNLFDHTQTLYDRAATYEGALTMCSRKFVSPENSGMLQNATRTLVQRLQRAVGSSTKLLELELIFKIDAKGTLWFLWCPHVACSHTNMFAVPRPSIGSPAKSGEALMTPHAKAAGRFVQHLRQVAELGHSTLGVDETLSWVRWTQADYDREFMLTSGSRTQDLFMGSPSRSHSNASQRRPHSSNDARSDAMSRRRRTLDARSPPTTFTVPKSSKIAALWGVTRSASRISNNIRWNEQSPTLLAITSGIARTRTREEFDCVPLHAKCFNVEPVHIKTFNPRPIMIDENSSGASDGVVTMTGQRSITSTLALRSSLSRVRHLHETLQRTRAAADVGTVPMTEIAPTTKTVTPLMEKQANHSPRPLSSPRPPRSTPLVHEETTVSNIKTPSSTLENTLRSITQHLSRVKHSPRGSEPASSIASTAGFHEERSGSPLDDTHNTTREPVLLHFAKNYHHQNGPMISTDLVEDLKNEVIALANSTLRSERRRQKQLRWQCIGSTAEAVIDFITAMSRVGRLHFRTFPASPLAFSTTPRMFPDAEIRAAFEEHLLSVAPSIQQVEIQHALYLDCTVQRNGLVDELAWHHDLSVALGQLCKKQQNTEEGDTVEGEADDLMLPSAVHCFALPSAAELARVLSSNSQAALLDQLLTLLCELKEELDMVE